MTKWLEIAAALDPPVPEESARIALAGMEQLEKTLASQFADLPIDTLPWDGR